MMVVLWVFFLLVVTGGVLVGRGKKIGMWIAAPPLVLMLCSFPVSAAATKSQFRAFSRSATSRGSSTVPRSRTPGGANVAGP